MLTKTFQRGAKIISTAIPATLIGKGKVLSACLALAFTSASIAGVDVCRQILSPLLKLEYVKDAREWQLTDQHGLGIFSVAKAESKDEMPLYSANEHVAAWIEIDTLHVVNLQTAEHRKYTGIRQKVKSFVINTDGTRLLIRTGGSNEAVTLLTVSPLSSLSISTYLGKLNPHKADRAVAEIFDNDVLKKRNFAISSDFKTIAVLDPRGRISVLSLVNNEVRFNLSTYSHFFGFSKNGQYFVTVDSGRTAVEIYNLQGKMIARYKDTSRRKEPLQVHKVTFHDFGGHDYVTVDFVKPGTSEHDYQFADLELKNR
ncbi:MAG TPA: hypothetical protein PLU50_02625 [Pseudobdellovibrionaceae bacterium]|nr:hypothetical protein [Pseudobdellovibrionaceae bacterium]